MHPTVTSPPFLNYSTKEGRKLEGFKEPFSFVADSSDPHPPPSGHLTGRSERPGEVGNSRQYSDPLLQKDFETQPLSEAPSKSHRKSETTKWFGHKNGPSTTVIGMPPCSQVSVRVPTGDYSPVVASDLTGLPVLLRWESSQDGPRGLFTQQEVSPALRGYDPVPAPRLP